MEAFHSRILRLCLPRAPSSVSFSAFLGLSLIVARLSDQNRDTVKSQQLRAARVNEYKPDNVIAKSMFREVRSEAQVIGEHEKTIRDILDRLSKATQ